MEDNRLLTETVTELVHEGAFRNLARILEEQPPEALADLLEHLDAPTRETAFEVLEPHLAGEVAVLIDDTIREELLEDVSSEQIVERMENLEADEAVSIPEDTDPETWCFGNSRRMSNTTRKYFKMRS